MILSEEPLRVGHESPVDAGLAREPKWGSDAIAGLLRDLGLQFVALNPGSSYRGLHDSLVNYLGNQAPQLLLCLHEEHAVALAHGYAKASGTPMAVAVHSNVGLMHASMAIFNAYCDRVPILILGATGPLDAHRRRPWIDWLHTAVDQAALVRPFIKWDDQPISAQAALHAVAQAYRLTASAPTAPTYVCLDASMQEAELSGPLARPSVERFAPSLPAAPSEDTIAAVANRLASARRPLLLVGRVSRSEQAWRQRIELAERLHAAVFTHLKLAAAFPTTHPLMAEPPHAFTSARLRQALQEADVVLALDWLDLGGALQAAGDVHGYVVAVSLDEQLHSGWGKESLAPVPADAWLAADVDATVSALLQKLPPTPDGGGGRRAWVAANRADEDAATAASTDRSELTVRDIASALRTATGNRPTTLVRVPNGWSGDLWHADHPLDILGADGGEGIGSGPGMVVGVGLALCNSGRLPIAVLGDGDYVMGVSALWTAAHYELPLLVVVANNRSFFNDEIHQHQVAVRRDRPTQNRWIGQHITGPEIDLAVLASAQGLTAYGPVNGRDELERVIAVAVEEAQAGASVVVDVHIASDVEHETSRAVTQGGRR